MTMKCLLTMKIDTRVEKIQIFRLFFLTPARVEFLCHCYFQKFVEQSIIVQIGVDSSSSDHNISSLCPNLIEAAINSFQLNEIQIFSSLLIECITFLHRAPTFPMFSNGICELTFVTVNSDRVMKNA